MKVVLNTLADNRKAGSFADRLRKKRFALFKSLIEELPAPVKIIDVGGTELYWERMGFLPNENAHITILNLHKTKANYPNVIGVAGDGRDMKQFDDNSFDVAFSNSVIEHVGSFEDQQAMAKEIQRVAQVIYLQTPNRYFPIEPHFLFPFFQFLPVRLRVWMLMRFNLGWYEKAVDKEKARSIVTSIRLLSRKELKRLFPGATIYRERFMGLVKSFVVVDGFSQRRRGAKVML